MMDDVGGHRESLGLHRSRRQEQDVLKKRQKLKIIISKVEGTDGLVAHHHLKVIFHRSCVCHTV